MPQQTYTHLDFPDVPYNQNVNILVEKTRYSIMINMWSYRGGDNAYHCLVITKKVEKWSYGFRNSKEFEGFYVLTANLLTIQVFWDTIPCWWVKVTHIHRNCMPQYSEYIQSARQEATNSLKHQKLFTNQHITSKKTWTFSRDFV